MVFMEKLFGPITQLIKERGVKMISQYIFAALIVYLMGAVISLAVAFLIKSIYVGIKLQGNLKLRSAQLRMSKASLQSR